MAARHPQRRSAAAADHSWAGRPTGTSPRWPTPTSSACLSRRCGGRGGAGEGRAAAGSARGGGGRGGRSGRGGGRRRGAAAAARAGRRGSGRATRLGRATGSAGAGPPRRAGAAAPPGRPRPCLDARPLHPFPPPQPLAHPHHPPPTTHHPKDVIYVHHPDPAPGSCHSMFMVCDGHQGAGAARHVAQYVPSILARTLPQELPEWDNAAGALCGRVWGEAHAGRAWEVGLGSRPRAAARVRRRAPPPLLEKPPAAGAAALTLPAPPAPPCAPGRGRRVRRVDTPRHQLRRRARGQQMDRDRAAVGCAISGGGAVQTPF
jgi:hypothetical protein